MAFRFAILIAFAVAVPSDRPGPTCQSAQQTHEQARLLLSEWRKAIRSAETPEDWAAVDAIAQEVSRLAAPGRPQRTRVAKRESSEAQPTHCAVGARL